MKVHCLVLASLLASSPGAFNASESAGTATPVPSGGDSGRPQRVLTAASRNRAVKSAALPLRPQASQGRSDSDLVGTDSASGLQFIPVPPCRVADTREPAGPFGGPKPTAGSTREFDIPHSVCNIPNGAVAYSLNVTVVPDAALGYLTIWPTGENQPLVSTLNSDGRVKANAAIVPAGTDGGVNVFVPDATQVILDIDGYFVAAGAPGGLDFFPVTPCRLVDTRNAAGPLGGPFLAANTSRAFPVQSSCSLPSTAQAYSLNVTAVPHGKLGYLTIWPTGEPQPLASTLNAPTGAVTANAAIVPASSGGDVSVFVDDAADVILDVNGYFAPPAPGGLSLYPVTPCRVIDTRRTTGNFDGALPVAVESSVCAPPAGAQAYVLNATVVPPGSLGYLTLWPEGEAQPLVSTLNAGEGAVTSNMAIVPTTNGSIDAFSDDRTQLILDISSYFAAAATKPAATPVFSPTEGTYTSPPAVTITDATAGATIYFTTDGSTPTTGSTKYTGAITVSASETLQAIAVAPEYLESGVAAAAYTLQAATPVFTPSEGIYGGTQTVTITDTTAGATVYYTVDGTTPTTGSTKYAGAITVSASETLEAIAAAPGYSPSTVATTRYTIGAATVPEIITVAGNGTYGFSGDGGIATAASLGYVDGVAVDGMGNIYIADASNYRIRKVSAGTFTITTVAGNGDYGFSGDGGAATSAEIGYPEGIAVDSAGNLYIADPSTARIRMVSASTGIITTVAGNGTYGFSGDGGAATSAGLSYFQGVAVDGAGNLYIADTDNQRIRKVTASTGIITTIAGNGNYGYSGDGSAATNAELGYPQGVAVDSAGNLYIADTDNARIRMVSASTGIITTVAGNGYGFSGDGGPATSAELEFPGGLAVDSAANIYIADQGNSRIRKVTASTGIITTIAGDYATGYSGDGGPATSAALGGPASVAVDIAGNVYIADSGNNVVREVSLTPPQLPHYVETPAFSVAAGTYFAPQTVAITDVTAGATIYYTTDGTTPTTSSTEYTGAITVGATETVNAIAVASGYRQSGAATAAYTITPVTSPEIVTVAGIGAPGYGGDGGIATDAELLEPGSVAIDSKGNLYIADTYNARIRMVSASTGIITTVAGNGTYGFSGDGGAATSAGLLYPQGVAVDGAGNLYIADTYNARIRKVTASTGIITTVAGNGTGGFSGDEGPATLAELGYPQGVAVDSAGNLYIADTYNQRIRKVTASTGIITTVAGNGTGGFSGDEGPATIAELAYPYGVAVDSAGNIYIGDSSNARVRKVTASTGVIATVAGNGNFGYTGDQGPATAAELGYPQGVAVDSAGNIYIGDSSNASVRKVTASTGVIATVAGNGLYGYTGDQGPATAAELGDPVGVAVDGAGDLYILDEVYAVVREVSLSPLQLPRFTASPVFTPYGGTYDGMETVAISDSTAAATLYYTTNGTTPTTSSTIYTGPFTITASATVEAIAVAPGYKPSAVASAAFVIAPPAAATPTFNLAQGSYSTAQSLTILDTTAGAAIYYTTDGSTPTTSSTKYVGAITLSITETVQAIAVAAGYSQSAVATATYTLNVPAAAARATGTYGATR
jgi:sugar lactone lactonase YvrE